ncbi:hypothetical protein BY996DRAFT_6454186 [Phakopsora pachyrhizi]|nr:hypothetical protein BY996DRAFT_6454186 [Phakopsora pachyrhizi]
MSIASICNVSLDYEMNRSALEKVVIDFLLRRFGLGSVDISERVRWVEKHLVRFCQSDSSLEDQVWSDTRPGDDLVACNRMMIITIETIVIEPRFMRMSKGIHKVNITRMANVEWECEQEGYYGESQEVKTGLWLERSDLEVQTGGWGSDERLRIEDEFGDDDCSDDGCYEVDWIGWMFDYELDEVMSLVLRDRPRSEVITQEVELVAAYQTEEGKDDHQPIFKLHQVEGCETVESQTEQI